MPWANPKVHQIWASRQVANTRLIIFTIYYNKEYIGRINTKHELSPYNHNPL